MAELLVVRHGETEWSAAGRHTGLTDLPLTSHGRAEAAALGRFLTERFLAAGAPALVLTSPLQRARETAQLAGLDRHEGGPPAVVDDDLSEWDYGGFEGLTTDQVTALLGRPWSLFADGVPPGATPGETLADVAARASAVVGRVRPVLDDGGDVVLVAHGHLLRVLTAVWLELTPADGAAFVVAAGSLGTLGFEHERPSMLGWNQRAAPTD